MGNVSGTLSVDSRTDRCRLFDFQQALKTSNIRGDDGRTAARREIYSNEQQKCARQTPHDFVSTRLRWRETAASHK